MKREKDFEELLRLFNSNKVKYCIVGSFAVAFHARPRYTKDIDILIEPEIENAKKVIKSLNEFGFKNIGLCEKDFCTRGRVIQLGYEPVRIDILTSIEGSRFKTVWQNKVRGKYGDERVFFMGLNELIKNKNSSKRTQDLIDAEMLADVKRKKEGKR